MIYSIHNTFRLYARKSVLRNKCFNHVRVTNSVQDVKKYDKNKEFQLLLQKYKEKITFSSYLDCEKLELGYYKYHLKTIKKAKQIQVTEYKLKSLPQIPIALQYILDKERLPTEQVTQETIKPETLFQLPFASKTQIDFKSHDSHIEKQDKITAQDTDDEFDQSNIHQWMTNYEQFDDTKLNGESDNVDSEWSKYYGTPDPTANVSTTPCGGCGALLHCSDPAIPGYLPSEIYKGQSAEELTSIECQRCHFLKEYNIALDVTVQPEEYENLLQSIRHVKSLVVLMVDLLDFPCSIWPGIVDIIGTQRPIIIVGNKVDLLPGDSVGYLKRIKESLVTEIERTKLKDANIKYISLISAKTGYGIEDLISAMFKVWLGKGDVFLVGCTNVGKSSLFNVLLQSDYCKVHAIDLVKRATVSRWPGTTLNLLKFPVNRPSGWKIYQRTRRLKSEAKLMKVEKEIRKAQRQGRAPTEAPALIGHIGRSFSLFDETDDGFLTKNPMTVLNENDKVFRNSKWFYDTPGVMHPDQVLALLSTEELLITIPKQMIRPQTYYLNEGSTIFIAGLARVDLVESPLPSRFTIFCSESLPITVTKTEDADEVYNSFLGTELFAVPSGGTKRLSNWPGLQKREELLEFSGKGPKLCCGDVVLSSIAWVSITAKGDTVCRVAAWTPGARGIHRRIPSILPYAINLKGKRLRETPAYMIGKPFADQE